MLDEFVIVRLSNFELQLLVNIAAPYFDLALAIDKSDPSNEFELLQYIAPPFDFEEQFINSVEVMFIRILPLNEMSKYIAPPVLDWEL